MHVFSSMIFNHLHHRLQSENKEKQHNGLQINTINDVISDIIRKRKLNEVQTNASCIEDNNEEQSTKASNYDDLPDAIIQNVASFLPFRSYSLFQCCCRSVFFAANNPSTLYELPKTIRIEQCIDTNNIHKLQLFMKRFERIQKLEVHEGNEKYLGCIKFRNLRELELHGLYTNQEYISMDSFDWDSIETLRIEFDGFFEIISRCNNLSSLVIDYFYDDTNKTTAQQLSSIPHWSQLQCLALCREANIDSNILLKDICNTLQSLVICPQYHNVNGLTFSNLVELCLDVCPGTSQQISHIIKTTKRLERLSLLIDTDSPTHADIGDSAFCEVFEEIFALNTLNYFRINWYLTSNLARLIESALHKKRQRLKLELYLGQISSKKKMKVMQKTLMSILDALCAWHSGDFMLIWNFLEFGTNHSTVCNQWLKKLSTEFSVDTVNWMDQKKKTKTLVIATKMSVFNGYKEKCLNSLILKIFTVS